MNDVFISYKSEEFTEANWVKQTLENNGISCWMAPNSIPGGSSYAVEIPQAIRECKVFVLILTKQTQSSKWVPREIDQAINFNKTIMPFMLENCALQDDFNFYLTNVQRYAAYESKSAAVKKMIDEIRAILNAKAASAESNAYASSASSASTAGGASFSSGASSLGNTSSSPNFSSTEAPAYTKNYTNGNYGTNYEPIGSTYERPADIPQTNNAVKNVKFFEAVKLMYSNYVNFNGRATKQEFWYAEIFSIIILMLTNLFFAPLAYIFAVASFLPLLALSVRRLHDIGKTWYNLFFALIPLAGPIYLIVLYCKDSDGENRWSAKQ